MQWFKSPRSLDFDLRPIVLVKSKSEERVIKEGLSKLEKYLKEGQKRSLSSEQYIQFEKGAIDLVSQYLSKLNQTFNGLQLLHTNTKEKTDHDRIHSELTCTQSKGLQRAKNQFEINRKNLIHQRRIKLAPLMEQLKTSKSLIPEYESELKRLSEKLTKKVNIRRGFGWKRTLIILGIVISALAEASNTFSSSMILKADPIMEIATVIGISLGLIVSSKTCVYLFTHGNLLHRNNEAKSKIFSAYDFGGIILLAFTICFVILLGELRLTYMAATGTKISASTIWFVRLLGLFLFTATLALSMLLANPLGKTQALYSQVLQQKNRAKKRVEKLYKRINEIRSEYLNQYQTIQEEYQEKKLFHTREKTEQLNQELLSTTNTQNTVLTMSRESKMEFILGCSSILKKYRALTYEKTKNTNINWPSLELSHLVNDPTYQRPFKHN